MKYTTKLFLGHKSNKKKNNDHQGHGNLHISLLFECWLRKISITNGLCSKLLFVNHFLGIENFVLLQETMLNISVRSQLVHDSWYYLNLHFHLELTYLYYSSLGPLSSKMFQLNCALIDFCGLSDKTTMFAIYCYENKQINYRARQEKKSDQEYFLFFMSPEKAGPWTWVFHVHKWDTLQLQILNHVRWVYKTYSQAKRKS